MSEQIEQIGDGRRRLQPRPLQEGCEIDHEAADEDLAPGLLLHEEAERAGPARGILLEALRRPLGDTCAAQGGDARPEGDDGGAAIDHLRQRSEHLFAAQ